MLPNPPEPILTIVVSVFGLLVLLYFVVMAIDYSQGIFKNAPLYTVLTTPLMQAFVYMNLILPVVAVLALIGYFVL